MTLDGILDIHTHGIGRYDTRTVKPSDILKIAELHASKGIESVVLAIYPGTVSEMRGNMEAVRRAMEMRAARPASRILGVHLEGPFLNPARCGALDGGSFLIPGLSSLQELIGGYEDIIRIITVAPELPGALKVIERCRASGIRVNLGHSDATYKEALEGKNAGATGVTHLFNAMRPFHHREPGLAGLGLMDEDLYVEVIADHFHLHPLTLELVFSRKRLDRIILVSDSVKHAGGKGGGRPSYRKGLLAGSGITVADSFKVLEAIGIPAAEIIEAAVDNPARYLT